MQHSIYNDHIRVAVSEQGAELQSLYLIAEDQEYMWSGDSKFWGKKSPILFPIVGGLKEGKYTWNGNDYFLGRHGFARERRFQISFQAEDQITFSLEDDEESRKVYPFAFKLEIDYTLIQNQVKVTYRVFNRQQSTLYFSIGAHPAFSLPIENNLEYADYEIEFDIEEDAPIYPLSKDNLLETTPVPCLKGKHLPLTKQLFYGDALVFKNLQSNTLHIKSSKGNRGFTFTHDGFPYMGIWSAKDAPFVCIEPWQGIADSVNASGKLEEKEGILSLEPNEMFSKSWSVLLW